MLDLFLVIFASWKIASDHLEGPQMEVTVSALKKVMDAKEVTLKNLVYIYIFIFIFTTIYIYMHI